MDRIQGRGPALQEARATARVTPLPSRLRYRLLDVAAGRHTPGSPLDWEDADLVEEGLIEIRRDRGRTWAEITDRGRAALRGSR